MSCNPVAGGVNISNCGNSGFEGAPVADVNPPPWVLAGVNRATFPISGLTLGNMFLDNGGGFCSYPLFSNAGNDLSPGFYLTLNSFDDWGANIPASSPIWLVVFYIYGCADVIALPTQPMEIIMQRPGGPSGVLDDGVTPSEYTFPASAGATIYPAYFPDDNGNPWTWANLLNNSGVFDIEINGLGGEVSFDLRASWIEVFYGAAVGFNIEATGGASPDLGFDITGGIEFSGSPTQVLSADVSGIYTLVKDKRNDTLYQRFGTDATIDVAIPEPFIKTGYLGS